MPDGDYQQLQHFISESPWDGLAVMNRVAEKVGQTLGLSKPVPGIMPGMEASTGLLLDESGWEKSGKKSVGVARQYIGQVGKVANGQVGVFAALCSGGRVGLLQGRLYLPREWALDGKRCEKAGIPVAERAYRTKPELAVEILGTLPGGVSYDWVGGDSIYGNSPCLRQYLYGVGQPFVLDVWLWKPEQGAYVEKCQLLISTEADGSEVKHSLCYQPNGRMPLETALFRQMQRYWIERAFQNVKEHNIRCAPGTHGTTTLHCP